MICIILNSTKKKILKDIAFTILNRYDKYAFLSNREQCYGYIVDAIDIKLLKTKITKDLKIGPKNVGHYFRR